MRELEDELANKNTVETTTTLFEQSNSVVCQYVNKATMSKKKEENLNKVKDSLGCK